MAKLKNYQITILTPVNNSVTLVREQARLNSGAICHNFICVRANIFDDEGTPPSAALAEVFSDDPGANPTAPGNGHEAEVGGPWDGYNARWDHQGGSVVDDVDCKCEEEYPDNWLVVWARWGSGTAWQEFAKVKFFGKCANKTECE